MAVMSTVHCLFCVTSPFFSISFSSFFSRKEQYDATRSCLLVLGLCFIVLIFQIKLLSVIHTDPWCAVVTSFLSDSCWRMLACGSFVLWKLSFWIKSCYFLLKASEGVCHVLELLTRRWGRKSKSLKESEIVLLESTWMKWGQGAQSFSLNLNQIVLLW